MLSGWSAGANTTSDWSLREKCELVCDGEISTLVSLQVQTQPPIDWSVREKQVPWLVSMVQTQPLIGLWGRNKCPGWSAGANTTSDWSVRETQVPHGWIVCRCMHNLWLVCEKKQVPWLVCRCKHILWLVREGEMHALVSLQVQTQPLIGLWGRNKCSDWSAGANTSSGWSVREKCMPWLVCRCKHNLWLVREGEMRALVSLQVQTQPLIGPWGRNASSGWSAVANTSSDWSVREKYVPWLVHVGAERESCFTATIQNSRED